MEIVSDDDSDFWEFCGDSGLRSAVAGDDGVVREDDWWLLDTDVSDLVEHLLGGLPCGIELEVEWVWFEFSWITFLEGLGEHLGLL